MISWDLWPAYNLFSASFETNEKQSVLCGHMNRVNRNASSFDDSVSDRVIVWQKYLSPNLLVDGAPTVLRYQAECLTVPLLCNLPTGVLSITEKYQIPVL